MTVHIEHRLKRVLACDPAGGMAEAVACHGCAMVVLQPRDMPDYSQVARLWRNR